MLNFWKKFSHTNITTLVGPNRFDVEAVGELNYQREFLKIVGKKNEDGFNEHVEAVLIPENENPYDNKAIRIDVKGKTVGYLDRQTARKYRKMLKSKNLPLQSFKCSALIVGGWDRGNGDTGHFGIRLDL